MPMRNVIEYCFSCLIFAVICQLWKLKGLKSHNQHLIQKNQKCII